MDDALQHAEEFLKVIKIRIFLLYWWTPVLTVLILHNITSTLFSYSFVTFAIFVLKYCKLPVYLEFTWFLKVEANFLAHSKIVMHLVCQ